MNINKVFPQTKTWARQALLIATLEWACPPHSCTAATTRATVGQSQGGDSKQEQGQAPRDASRPCYSLLPAKPSPAHGSCLRLHPACPHATAASTSRHLQTL